MASAKRKQDEKNLKTLRELVSQSGNRECFDCRQRGPTYVNMTIGSFVCTSCSGMLRGLTPPHRVKSISMATFTQDEIKFLRERGNDYCRKTWLGLLNNRNPIDFDTTDEQGMKDHMIQKYELKRYYLEPMVGADVSDNSEDEPVQNNQLANKQQTSRNNANTIQTKAIPRVPNPVASVPVKSRTKTEPSFVTDFVADFSKVPDPFSIASPIKSTPIQPQPSFANFDNNPIFNNVKNAETSQFDNNKSAFLSSNLNGVNAPPPEDRYAALKDLDSLMKQTQLKDDNLTKSTWNSNANGPNVNWGMTNTGTVISNPFVSGDLWRPTSNFVNNNMQPMDNSFCTNPFRPTHFPMNNDSLWSGRESQNNEDVISSSQLMTSLSGKTWQPSVTAYHANPFMVGSGVSDMSRNSNNPFL